MRTRLLPLLSTSLALTSLGCGGGAVTKAREALEAGQPDVAMTLLTDALADDPSDPVTLTALGDVYLMQARQSREARSEERARELLVKAADAWRAAAAAEGAPCEALERGVAAAHLTGVADAAPADDAKLKAVLATCGNGDWIAASLPRLAEIDPDGLRAAIGEWIEGDRVTLPQYTREAKRGLGFTIVETRPLFAAAANGDQEAGEAPVAPGFVGTVKDAEKDGTFVFPDTAHVETTDERGWIDWSKDNCGSTVRDPRWWTESYTCKARGVSVDRKDVSAGLREGDRVQGARCTGTVGKGRSIGFMNTARCEVRFTRVRSPYRSLLAESAVFHPATLNGRAAGLATAATLLSAPRAEDLRAGRVAKKMPMAWVIAAVAPTCATAIDVADGFRGEAVVRRCTLDDVTLTFVDGVLEEWTGLPTEAPLIPPPAATGRIASPEIPRSAGWKMADDAKVIPALAPPAGAGVTVSLDSARGEAVLTAPIRAAATTAGFPELDLRTAVAVDLDRDGVDEVFACGRGERGQACLVFPPGGAAVELSVSVGADYQLGAMDIGPGRYLVVAGGDGSWASVDAVRYDGTTYVATNQYTFQNDGY